MGKRAVKLEYRRAGDNAPSQPKPFLHRWYGKLAMVLLHVLLLSLAYAPYHQFYLAFVGLIPLLVVVRNTASPWRAFGWGWLAGTLFFSANMWWLGYVTGPGTIALMLILGLYPALAGVLIRGLGLLEIEPPVEGDQSANGSGLGRAAQVFGIATVWVGLEWLRGFWPFDGLPWLYIGHTQTPFIAAIQIADFSGALGVSFFAALVNGWLALWVLNRASLQGLKTSLVTVAAAAAFVIVYGLYRIAETPRVTTPGPKVLVVQPAYPQSNTGQKGAGYEIILPFHMDQSRAAVAANPDVDLIVWSETMMPPLNPEARAFYPRYPLYWEKDGKPLADFIEGAEPVTFQTVHERIEALSRELKTPILAGGMYGLDFTSARRYAPREERNAAYYYQPAAAGSSSPALHYEKMHLVPFGEYIPFKEGWPWLYRQLIDLGPPNMEDYQLQRGDRVVHFPLPRDGQPGAAEPLRFVTPICFEDIVARVVRRMFDGSDRKAADFMVNITNDGWFKANQQPQHLQAAIFRSVENRAPTARSVNTGISGFIDSCGRTHNLVAPWTEGAAVATIAIDSRYTFFSRHGDLFAMTCAGVTGLLAAGASVRWWSRRMARRRQAGDAS